MTQLEAEIWIRNMENHFGSNLISRKYEVEHALQFFTQSAAIWWKMHHAIQGFSGAETWDEFKKTLLRSRLIRKCYDNPKEKTCACKICGEIGHTQEEHKDGCTHYEENHPAEECPSSQVTCFLCEGTTHYPAQCHIYPKVQQVVKQQKDAVKETPEKKILEEPVMMENVEEPNEQGVTRFFSNACYSCGGEGHYSQDCTKRSQEYLGNFPTEKVEFYPLEIEELAKIKESGKKKKYPQKGQISTDIDLSHLLLLSHRRCEETRISRKSILRTQPPHNLYAQVEFEKNKLKLECDAMKRLLEEKDVALADFEKLKADIEQMKKEMDEWEKRVLSMSKRANALESFVKDFMANVLDCLIGMFPLPNES
ncbi:hypothetical protein D1007_06539 [Hordeum vulgare]|nr:hypothetical protein D1007_06539 [Hordeum vulgare]